MDMEYYCGKNNDDELIDIDYKNWVNSISQRYKQSRIKAAVAVNKELVEFYWFLGREIVEREVEKKYGSGFYNSLSKD